MAVKTTDLPNVLRSFYKARRTPHLVGPPGIGKSALVDQTRALISKDVGGAKVDLITYTLTDKDAVDVRGFLLPDQATNTASFTRPPMFPRMDLGASEYGILFLDEFAQADQIIQKACSSVIYERRIDDVYLPDGWSVVMASNRMSDRAGVGKPLMHNVNRVCTIEVTPDPVGWRVWAEAMRVHPTVISFAMRNVGVVFSGEVPAKDNPYCTPRSLCMLGDTLKAMMPDDTTSAALPTDHISIEVMKGWIGEGAAHEFLAFAKLSNEVPEFEEILKSPSTFPMPKEPDILYILAQYCAANATMDNLGATMQYTNRMPKDYQTHFMKSIMTRDQSLMLHESYIQWNIDNGDLILSVYS